MGVLIVRDVRDMWSLKYCALNTCSLCLITFILLKEGGSGQRHDHTAGEHRRHLGGMASGKGSTAFFASAVS